MMQQRVRKSLVVRPKEENNHKKGYEDDDEKLGCQNR